MRALRRTEKRSGKAGPPRDGRAELSRMEHHSGYPRPIPPARDGRALSQTHPVHRAPGDEPVDQGIGGKRGREGLGVHEASQYLVVWHREQPPRHACAAPGATARRRPVPPARAQPVGQSSPLLPDPAVDARPAQLLGPNQDPDHIPDRTDLPALTPGDGTSRGATAAPSPVTTPTS